MILRTVTYDQDTIVFAPPLILTEPELNEMLNILDKTFQYIESTLAQGSESL